MPVMMKRIAALAALLCALLLFDQARPADAAQALPWKGCGGGFQCATLQVPLDYSKPDGRQISLALIRRPASDQSRRVGSLLTNPGGPGASGVDFVRAWAGQLSSEVTDRFDVVGFDPRGIGQSAPIVCHDNLQEYVAADPTPDSQQEWDRLVAVTRTFADSCAQKYGDILPYLGTKNVARDLDRIRAAVGDDRLTYLGYSYGTVIGQVYADMFPKNVRAMVLDGAVDLSLSTDDRTLTQAMGFEHALDDYLADCAKESCDLAKRGDPAKEVDAVMAKAEAAPIPAKGADRPAGPGETLLGIITPLYSHDSWPTLTRALTAALDGNGALLVRLTDSYLGREPDGSYPNEQEANVAVNCLDQPPSQLPTTYQAYPAAARAFAEKAPHFGAAFANGLACAFWAARPDPLSVPKAAGAPPIVVVDTTGDPATPYAWGVAVSKQLSSAVLLTYYGEGHTAYGGGDGCVDDAVNGYLVDLKAPATGMQCGTPRPGEQRVQPPTGQTAPATEAPRSEPATSPGAPASSGWSRGAVVVGAVVVVAVLLTLIMVLALHRRHG